MKKISLVSHSEASIQLRTDLDKFAKQVREPGSRIGFLKKSFNEDVEYYHLYSALEYLPTKLALQAAARAEEEGRARARGPRGAEARKRSPEYADER